MKKLLIVLLTLATATGAMAQATASLTINAAPGLFLISTNRLKVYSIETATTNAAAFRLWDNDNTNNVPNASTNGWYGTNFVNASYVSRASYLTNLTTSYTNPVGYISWYTNVGMWTVTTTNAAATNALAPLATIANGTAETRVTYQNVLFTRGAIVHATGNGTITLYYSPE